MRVEAAALFENGEPGTAIFEAIEEQGRILLILDRGDPLTAARDKWPLYFHPKQQELLATTERGLDYRYVGKPIDLAKFLSLPAKRCGFFRID